MPETQRRPVPRLDDSELETALAFLDFQRESVLIKCEGLSEEQLRTAVVETGTNLLGLVAHLTMGERYWFSHTLAGREPEQEWNFEAEVPAGTPVDDVFAAYRTACQRSDELVREIGDPAAPTAEAIDDRRLPLRWVLAHMSHETARHAGHADIIREQLDGMTGR